MSSTTSIDIPLMVQTSTDQSTPDYVTIINPDGSISYETNVHYQQPTIIRRSYRTPPKPKYQYMIEQEGKSYRCCQWCRYWCTRKCPIFDFCDRIVSCPLLFFILSGLFLLFLLIALLTLFGLLPSINPSRRFYGIISTLSIANRTTFIYGLDTRCAKYSATSNCFNISTSTSVVNVATTMIINHGVPINNNFYISFILLCFSLILYYIHYRVDIDII